MGERHRYLKHQQVTGFNLLTPLCLDTQHAGGKQKNKSTALWRYLLIIIEENNQMVVKRTFRYLSE
jgi:hypothetical protein